MAQPHVLDTWGFNIGDCAIYSEPTVNGLPHTRDVAHSFFACRSSSLLVLITPWFVDVRGVFVSISISIYIIFTIGLQLPPEKVGPGGTCGNIRPGRVLSECLCGSLSKMEVHY